MACLIDIISIFWLIGTSFTLHFSKEHIVSTEYEKALWEYIKALETENKELIKALTESIKLLEQFREQV